VLEDDATAPDTLEVEPIGLLEPKGSDVTVPPAERVGETVTLDEDDGKTELHFVLDFLDLDEGPTDEVEVEKGVRVEILELEDPKEAIVPLTELVGARLDVAETEITVPLSELEESTPDDEGLEGVNVTLPELLLDETITETLPELEDTKVTVPLDEIIGLALDEDVDMTDTTEDDVKLAELDWETELLELDEGRLDDSDELLVRMTDEELKLDTTEDDEKLSVGEEDEELVVEEIWDDELRTDEELLVGTTELELEIRGEEERTLLLEGTKDDVLEPILHLAFICAKVKVKMVKENIKSPGLLTCWHD